MDRNHRGPSRNRDQYWIGRSYCPSRVCHTFTSTESPSPFTCHRYRGSSNEPICSRRRVPHCPAASWSPHCTGPRPQRRPQPHSGRPHGPYQRREHRPPASGGRHLGPPRMSRRVGDHLVYVGTSFFLFGCVGPRAPRRPTRRRLHQPVSPPTHSFFTPTNVSHTYGRRPARYQRPAPACPPRPDPDRLVRRRPRGRTGHRRLVLGPPGRP